MTPTISAGRPMTGESRSRNLSPRLAISAAKFTMFEFSSGQSKLFQSFDDKVLTRLVWDPNGQSIFVVFAALGGDPFTVNTRLGAFSYPGAKFRILTNDVVDHDTISITADGKVLATLQDQSAMEADILDRSGSGAVTAVPGIPAQQILAGLDWTVDGHLLISEGTRLLRLAADGSDVATLLSDQAGWIREVASCDGGRSIYALWYLHGGSKGVKIWRTNADGSDPKAVTATGDTTLFGCSPDGKWIYAYDAWRSSDLMRYPTSGAAPELGGFRLASWCFASRRNALGRWTDDRRILQPGGPLNTDLQNQNSPILPRNANQSDRPIH